MSKLLEVADVLEKAASYIEDLESARVQKINDENQKVAQQTAERVAEVLGEPVSEELVEKLSGAPAGVQELVGRLASGGEVDSLGGAAGSEKTASVVEGMGPGEAGFLNFIHS